MKRLLIMLVLLPAACGDKPANNAGPVHDHVHSHAGQDQPLPEISAGPWKVKPTLKGEVKRGELTVIELRLSGGPTDQVGLSGQVEDSAGEVIPKAVQGFHAMKEQGAYGMHLDLPKNAPKDLTVRLTLTTQKETQETYFKLP